jgi:hypothetical protein
MPSDVEAAHMTPEPAVRCSSCRFAWNSATMAEGLRLLGSCPKCGGRLEFRGDASPAERFDRSAEPAVEAATAPHLVLGIPRR